MIKLFSSHSKEGARADTSNGNSTLFLVSIDVPSKRSSRVEFVFWLKMEKLNWQASECFSLKVVLFARCKLHKFASHFVMVPGIAQLMSVQKMLKSKRAVVGGNSLAKR